MLRFECDASNRALLILIMRIQWLKVHARAFRLLIEWTGKNTSPSAEKYKMVLCATGGMLYVELWMKIDFLAITHENSPIYEKLRWKIYWITNMKWDKKRNNVSDWLKNSLFFSYTIFKVMDQWINESQIFLLI